MNLQHNRHDKQRTPHRSCSSQHNSNPELSFWERLLGAFELLIEKPEGSTGFPG